MRITTTNAIGFCNSLGQIVIYGETGLKTFMVSYTGVVYEKDLGPDTLEEFQKMERFNPDKSWTPVVH